MSRKLFILIIALFFIALSASVWADEASQWAEKQIAQLREYREEVQQVLEIIYMEMEGHVKGDPDQIMSCYAPGFVGYRAWTEDPEDWNVRIVGLDSLRVKYAEPARGNPARRSKYPSSWEYFADFPHVHVKDNRAIVVWKMYSRMPDPKARETLNNMFRSVWLLAKIKGKWKITNWIGGVTDSQKVTKWTPEY